MKLLTKEILARFKQLGSQENEKDPIIVCKFFNPAGAGTWYAISYDEKEQLFFGYVSIFQDPNMDELGYFSLDEMMTAPNSVGLPIERDKWFGEKRLSEVETK